MAKRLLETTCARAMHADVHVVLLHTWFGTKLRSICLYEPEVRVPLICLHGRDKSGSGSKGSVSQPTRAGSPLLKTETYGPPQIGNPVSVGSLSQVVVLRTVHGTCQAPVKEKFRLTYSPSTLKQAAGACFK